METAKVRAATPVFRVGENVRIKDDYTTATVLAVEEGEYVVRDHATLTTARIRFDLLEKLTTTAPQKGPPFLTDEQIASVATELADTLAPEKPAHGNFFGPFPILHDPETNTRVACTVESLMRLAAMAKEANEHLLHDCPPPSPPRQEILNRDIARWEDAACAAIPDLLSDLAAARREVEKMEGGSPHEG